MSIIGAEEPGDIYLLVPFPKDEDSELLIRLNKLPTNLERIENAVWDYAPNSGLSSCPGKNFAKINILQFIMFFIPSKNNLSRVVTNIEKTINSPIKIHALKEIPGLVIFLLHFVARRIGHKHKHKS